MKMFKPLLLLFAVIALAGSLNGQTKLPTVSVKSLDGQTVSVQSIPQSGRLTVISFWATWCSPCKKELDVIAEVYEEWQKEYNVDIVAVSIDDARTAPKVKTMVDEKSWDYLVFLDTNQDLKNALNIQNVPYTLIVDGNGNIVWQHSGYVPGAEDELEAELKKLAGK